jgi:hypothetical protein
LNKTWNRKESILASTLALAALSYFYTTLIEFPAVYADPLRNSILFDEQINEGKRIDFVSRIVKDANASNIARTDPVLFIVKSRCNARYVPAHPSGKP